MSRGSSRQTALPFAIGFGVKTKEQVAALAAHAEGVVVGSALVGPIAESLDQDGKATQRNGAKGA